MRWTALLKIEFENADNNQYIYVICECDLFCKNERGEESFAHCSAIIESLKII
jgi:hypothetical protein